MRIETKNNYMLKIQNLHEVRQPAKALGSRIEFARLPGDGAFFCWCCRHCGPDCFWIGE